VKNGKIFQKILTEHCDYKIISKLLTNRMKPVLNKIIHTDQKGFVAGRNISENNRMIDDIIKYVDNVCYLYPPFMK
jgi:phosphoribosylformylglycinamidine (FGAM) synthase-like enzyme